MELKYGREACISHRKPRSNRTFMELKFARLFADGRTSDRSNRTFMELKCLFAYSGMMSAIVLIVPLWN